MQYQRCSLTNLSDFDERAEELDNFADMIACMKKDNFYIACTLGMYETGQILAISDYFINPKRIKDVISAPTHAYAESVLEDLTSEQKERMGFTKEDEKALKERLNIEWNASLKYESNLKKVISNF